jgi:hypothetical protein
MFYCIAQTHLSFLVIKCVFTDLCNSINIYRNTSVQKTDFLVRMNIPGRLVALIIFCTNLELLRYIPALPSVRIMEIAFINCLNWAGALETEDPQESTTCSYREPNHHIITSHVILIPSFHLRQGLENGLFTSVYPTKTICFPACLITRSYHSSWLYHPDNIWCRIPARYEAPHHALFSILLLLPSCQVQLFSQ